MSFWVRLVKGLVTAKFFSIESTLRNTLAYQEKLETTFESRRKQTLLNLFVKIKYEINLQRDAFFGTRFLRSAVAQTTRKRQNVNTTHILKLFTLNIFTFGLQNNDILVVTIVVAFSC